MKAVGKSLLALLMLWLPLRGLTLDEAYSISVEKNLPLKMENEKLAESKAAAKEVLTNFFPSVSAKASYTRLGKVPEVEFPTPMGNMSLKMGQEDNYNIQLTAQQLIFSGGQLLFGYRAALSGKRAQEFSVEQARRKLYINVAKAFYGVVQADSFYAATRIADRQMEEHLTNIHSMYEQGMLTENELLKAEVQLSGVESMIQQAITAQKLARMNLLNTLGLPLDTTIFLEWMPRKPDDIDVNLDKDIKTALTQRADILSIEQGVRALKNALRATYGTFLPNIVLIGNYSYKRPNEKLEPEFYDTYDATLAASMDVFLWGKRIQQIKEKKAQLNQAELGLEMAKRGVQMELTAAARNLEEKKVALDISAKKLKAASDGYEVTKSMFRSGAATNSDLLDTQSDLTQTHLEHIKALFDYEMAQLNYKLSAGEKLFSKEGQNE